MIIRVKVIPNSKEQRIEKTEESAYRIYLNSAPEKNKANKELIKLLKNHFNKTPEILKGRTSRVKIIKLE
ncbi:MAG: DUF167 domain-containing protein [Nitrosopumilaceae archaeon]